MLIMCALTDMHTRGCAHVLNVARIIQVLYSIFHNFDFFALNTKDHRYIYSIDGMEYLQLMLNVDHVCSN